MPRVTQPVSSGTGNHAETGHLASPRVYSPSVLEDDKCTYMHSSKEMHSGRQLDVGLGGDFQTCTGATCEDRGSPARQCRLMTLFLLTCYFICKMGIISPITGRLEGLNEITSVTLSSTGAPWLWRTSRKHGLPAPVLFLLLCLQRVPELSWVHHKTGTALGLLLHEAVGGGKDTQHHKTLWHKAGAFSKVLREG